MFSPAFRAGIISALGATARSPGMKRLMPVTAVIIIFLMFTKGQGSEVEKPLAAVIVGSLSPQHS